MLPESAILRDLLAGQSTADSVAGRIGKPTGAVAAIMDRMAKDGTLQIARIMDTVPIYQLSPRTHQQLTDHQP